MALDPKNIPMAQQPSDTDTLILRQNKKPTRLAWAMLITAIKAVIPAGAAGPAGPAGAPKRVEGYSATSNASGVASVTFSPAFSAPPIVDVIQTWTGDQMITGGVTAVTATGCTIAVKRSRGTLLLTSGPFEAAPNTAVSVRVIGS